MKKKEGKLRDSLDNTIKRIIIENIKEEPYDAPVFGDII